MHKTITCILMNGLNIQNQQPIYRPLHAFVNYELIGRICLSGIQPATGTIELDVPLCSAPGQFEYTE